MPANDLIDVRASGPVLALLAGPVVARVEVCGGVGGCLMPGEPGRLLGRGGRRVAGSCGLGGGFALATLAALLLLESQLLTVKKEKNEHEEH